MEMESCVPPGFRFHPTEEELVGYYLTKKVQSEKIDLGVITDIDLYRIEPWDLQGRCSLGYEERNEWYFFSHKDKKYPTGTRTNRATQAGFWKATGRDKAVLAKQKIIGMRKTLVFYKGRAPNGRKTDWIMHEYRLQNCLDAPPQEEGWVVCRAFKKQGPNPRPSIDPWNPSSYNGMQTWQNTASTMQFPNPNHIGDLHHRLPIFIHDQELEESKQSDHLSQILELPQLESPSLFSSADRGTPAAARSEYCRDSFHPELLNWKTIDKLLASQLTDPASSSSIPSLRAAVAIEDCGEDAPNLGNEFHGLFSDN